MKIISISGSGSGAGKTTLATLMLPMLPGFAAVKVSPQGIYTLVSDDPEVVGEEGRDTRRMLDAGAAHVVFVEGPREGLPEALPLAISLCAGAPGVLVEGNAAARALRPDLSIFVLGEDFSVKPGAEGLLTSADVVVVNVESDVPAPEAVEFIKTRNGKAKIYTIRQIREQDAEFVKLLTA